MINWRETAVKLASDKLTIGQDWKYLTRNNESLLVKMSIKTGYLNIKLSLIIDSHAFTK